MSDNTFPTPDASDPVHLRFAADVVERVHADHPDPTTLVWSSAYGLRAEATKIEKTQAEKVQRDREIEAGRAAFKSVTGINPPADGWIEAVVDALDELRGDRA